MNIFGAFLTAVAFDLVSASSLEDRLKTATIDGDIGSILSLVREGANPNVEFDNHQTPLIKLCELGDVQSAVELIHLGADKDFPGSEHCPLHTAIYSGNFDLVQTLVGLGCKSYDGKLTQVALCRDNFGIAKFMVDTYRDDFTKDTWISTFIQIMFDWGWIKKHNPEIIDYAISNAPIPVESRQKIYIHALVKAPEVYWEYLNKSGYVHNLTDENGVSFLMHTMGYWNDAIPTKLIHCQPTDLKQTDKNGNGLIHYAKFGPIFDALIELGADVNMKNNEGRTPLMGAVSKRDVRVVEMLLRRGADPDAVDNAGESVSNSDIVRYVLAQISN